MSATAGYKGEVEISANDSTWSPLEGCTNPSFPISKEVLDASGQGDGFMKRILGRYSGEVSYEVHNDPADAAQILLRAAFAADSVVYVRYGENGSPRYKAQFIVSGIAPSSDLGDTNKVTFELSSTSALTVL